MCGIAGYVYLDPARPADGAILERMTQSVAHRGPDGEAQYVSRNVALGHRRLAIIDLETGDQPMASLSGNLRIVQNGEIYNYLELRAELETLGHRFRTQSDTEVILEAYEEWGLDCFSHFNGMWAIALWDEPRRRLVLSRDRIGEKPLHYAQTADALVFGSEMKSLFAFGVPRERDLQWLEVFCSLGYLPAPHSFFRGVSKLPAGCLLIHEEGRDPEVRRYWDLPAIDEDAMILNGNAARETFASLLRDSVSLRMRSDVPYGAFLSGGLDSSCVVALMAELRDRPVQTFTIGFAQADYDERPLARMVADRFRTEHHEHEVHPAVFEDSLDQVMHHYDEPFGDSSAIPTGIVSRLARQEVKMVLSGDGGDEVLSGYTNYQGERFARDYQRLPTVLRNALPPLLRTAARASGGRTRAKLTRARNVAEASNQDFLHRLVQKTSWADVRTIKGLLRPVTTR
ncbi:MAG: asparagine synthase (glutamine-hydrolyzing), partial [Candidatus Eisenbacteria bacterium]|nr:asparagine synthase (glutamine-hydrolyzing) [Candidatus Eisenbacteria bacterium]